MATQDFFTSRNNGANGQTQVGQEGRLWYDPDTNVIRVSDGVNPGGTIVGGAGGGGGTATAAGSTTQVQYNNGGLFGANSSFTYNNATKTLTVPNVVADVTGDLTGMADAAKTVAGANVTGVVAQAQHSATADSANEVAGANVTGVVANATHAVTAGTANSVAAANITGTVSFATNSTTANVAKTVAGANVTGTVANATYALSSNTANTATSAGSANTANTANTSNTAATANTVIDSAQANITSLGNLTSLTVTGKSNLNEVGNVKITGGSSGQYLRTDGSGNLTWATVSSGVATTPGGSNTQVQYNDDGSFAGTDAFTFDNTTNTLSVTNIVGSFTGNISQVDDIAAATGEPTGFPDPDRTQTTIAFNNTSRTFTISAVGDDFSVWVKGTEFIKTTDTVTVDDITQLNYISYDSTGALQASTTFFDLANAAPVAYVYWNATTAQAEYFADERHGTTMDWQTHEYLHSTRGAAYARGFVINYTDTGTGSSNGDAQIGISSGTFYDEDIEISVVATTTPTVNTFQQDITLPGKIPVFYRSGNGWIMDNATSYPFKFGSNRPTYNLNTGGNWSATDISNNNYGVMYILATNNVNSPVISLMGQSQYSSIGAAQSASYGQLDLAGMPSLELRVLYQVIFQTSNSYTNAVKARVRSILDLRTEAVATLQGGGVNAVDIVFRENPSTVFSTDATANTHWNEFVANVPVKTVTNNAQPNITSVGTLTSLTVAGNILPDANITYDLGNSTHRFKDLYLANNTIYMGNATIKAVGTEVQITNADGNYVSVTVGGANTQVQFNNDGNFAGSNAFTFDSTSNTLSVSNIAGTLTTAEQPNVTSVGELTGLVMAGNITTSGASPAPSINGFSSISALDFEVGNLANLGDIANVKISGGFSGFVLKTLDGQGNLGFDTLTTIQDGQGNWVYVGDGGIEFAFTSANKHYYVTDKGFYANERIQVISEDSGSSGGTNILSDSFAQLQYAPNVQEADAYSIGNTNWAYIDDTGFHVECNVDGADKNMSFYKSSGNLYITNTFRGAGANLSGNLTVYGTSNLGNAMNVRILGGNAGQFLSTDGTGNLSWEDGGGSGGTVVLDENSNVTVNIITANTITSKGTGTPTYTSGSDFVFNTGSSSGALVVSGSVEATQVLKLAPKSSAPTATAGSFAVAQPPGWDPASKGGTAPYPVFYDGTSWTALY